MKTAAEVKVIEQELKDKGVKYCIGAYVDIHGIPKAKVVPIEHLPQMSCGSERYTAYALDGLGHGPSDDEIKTLLAEQKHQPDRRRWVEDIVWAMINSPEFTFID